MKTFLLLVLGVTLPLGMTRSEEPPRKEAAERIREAQKKQEEQVKKQRERAREDAKKQRERAREIGQKEDERAREGAKARAEARKEAEKRRAEISRERAGRIAEANARRQEQRQEARERMNEETARYLEDRGRRDWERYRRRYEERGRYFDTDHDAEDLIYSILGSAAAEVIEEEVDSRNRRFHRLSVDQVGRTAPERRNSVDYLTRRFLGIADYDNAPPEYIRDFYRYEIPDPPSEDLRYYRDDPYYFEGNRRVVYYDSRKAIPPVLLASDRLNRVRVTPYVESPYRLSEVDAPPSYLEGIPAEYRDDDAYAVSYAVKPDTEVSREDILFQQGTTRFADAYSYDIVVDLAEAMQSRELLGERFIIEGHASAEGDYEANLHLSQARAERIARDLVDMGVDPKRLIPVGYGETEARFPADAAETSRALDRRITVFTAAD